MKIRYDLFFGLMCKCKKEINSKVAATICVVIFRIARNQTNAILWKEKCMKTVASILCAQHNVSGAVENEEKWLSICECVCVLLT